MERYSRICIKNALNNNGVQLSFADKDTGKYDIDVRGNYTAATLTHPAPFIIYLDKSVATADAIIIEHSSYSRFDRSSCECCDDI